MIINILCRIITEKPAKNHYRKRLPWQAISICLSIIFFIQNPVNALAAWGYICYKNSI